MHSNTKSNFWEMEGLVEEGKIVLGPDLISLWMWIISENEVCRKPTVFRLSCCLLLASKDLTPHPHSIPKSQPTPSQNRNQHPFKVVTYCSLDIVARPKAESIGRSLASWVFCALRQLLLSCATHFVLLSTDYGHVEVYNKEVQYISKDSEQRKDQWARDGAAVLISNFEKPR